MSGFILSAFGDEISPDLAEQVEVLKAHDIYSIELRSIGGKSIVQHTDTEVRAAADFLKSAGVRVSAIGSPIGKISIEDDFGPHLSLFRRTVEIARAFETPFIRMFSFYMPARADSAGADSAGADPAGADPAAYRAEVLWRWQQFLAAASGSGLTLLHENEKGIYGDSAERCLDLLDSLQSPQCGATFDPANFVQCNDVTYPHAFQLLRRHIRYMHIKDALYLDGSVVPAGLGDGHLRDILAALSKDGFSGFLSIEPHLQESLPGGGPEKFAVAANALKDVLAQIGAAFA
jgi:sugar phosphate isomerase/epimerase